MPIRTPESSRQFNTDGSRTYEANNLMELSNMLYDLHQKQRQGGYVKPVLTIVNSNQAPVYKLIVTERL